MRKVIKTLTDIQTAVERIFRVVCLLCGTGLLLLLTGNVFTRIVPIVSLHWFGEIVELLFAWLVFLGAAVLYSRKQHFMIDWLSDRTSGTKFGPIYRIIINLVSLLFVGTLLVQGFRLTMLAHDWTSVLHMPRRLFYASMPVAGASMVYSSIVEFAGAIDTAASSRRELKY